MKRELPCLNTMLLAGIAPQSQGAQAAQLPFPPQSGIFGDVVDGSDIIRAPQLPQSVLSCLHPVPGQPRGHAGAVWDTVSDCHPDVPLFTRTHMPLLFSSHRRMQLAIIGQTTTGLMLSKTFSDLRLNFPLNSQHALLPAVGNPILKVAPNQPLERARVS